MNVFKNSAKSINNVQSVVFLSVLVQFYENTNKKCHLMKGTALLLLCAVTLAQAEQPQLTLSGKVCNCNPGEATNVCSQYGAEGQLVAHENCNQFYKCSDGSAIAYHCPANLLYSPLAEICDWPENVECGDKPIVAPGSENEDCSQENSNTGNEGNGGSDDSNNAGTCNCNPEDAPKLCAAEGSSGVLVAHQHCNQFYKCDHGVPAVLNCPSGLLYNPYTEQCDWAENVECGDRPIVEIEGGGNNGGDEDCEDGGNGNGESGVGGENGDNGGSDNGGTCNCNPAEAPGICAADGSNGVLVAHEYCNRFYKCAFGVPVSFFCPPGLLYNPYIECCDWPANVDCGDKPILEIGGGDNGGGGGDNGGGGGNGDNGTGGGNGGNSNEDNGGTCNCNPEDAPGICSSDGSDGTLVAHEYCNQFYKCAHGKPVIFTCPPGLVYNPYIECCDWPANVDCGDKPIVEVGGGGNGEGGGDNGGGDGNGDNGTGGGNGDNGTGGGNGGNSNEDNGGTCNCNPEDAPAICSSDGSDGTLVAHEYCNQFYKCDHGKPVTFTCPSGTVYNPYIESCDWPTNVDCGDKPIVEVGGGGNGEGGGDNGDGGGHGDNGTGGGNGGNSNEENGGTCNCNPEDAPEICSSDGSDGTFIAHEYCNQFYKCDHGKPVTFTCPSGTVYNPYIESCDWPANVDCGDKPIVEVGGGGNGDNDSGGNGNGDNDSGGNGNGDNDSGGNGNGDSSGGGGNGDNGDGDNGGTCNCNPGEAPGICAADGSDGILVAHEYCNQFYKCAHGVPVTFNCPPGLLYNPYIECCDWPANVDCGDKPIVEVGGGGDGEGGGDNGGGGGNGDNGTGGGNGDNGTGGENGGNSNEDNGGTCNCNPEDAPGICSSDGSDGTLVAHEYCNKFYKCAHGKPVTLTCPPGLVYNPYIECCDWPANVDCGDKPIVEVGGGGNGDNDSGGGNGDNSGGDNDGGDNGDNSGGDNDGGDNGGGDNGGGDNGGGDNGGTCNCNPGEAPGICDTAGSEGVLVAHENCNWFYKCSHGLPVALLCPEGLLYNPYIERCDWPALVECGDRPIVEGGGSGDNSGGDNGSGDNGSGDNGSGDNGGGDNGGGDNGGGDNGGGDNGGTCNCNPGEAPGICGAAGSEGVLVAHDNCNQFFKCSHGLPVALFCPEGLLYNPYIERCDWPALVECGDRPIVEGGGSGDNGSGDNGSGDNGGGDNGSGDNGGGDNGGGDNGGGDNGGTCNCNPGEAPGICGAAGSEGVLVAHDNCNQFFKCSHGLPVALFCPEGLLYNPYIERCDWPALVECGDRPIVEGGGSGDNGGGDNGSGDNGGGDNGGGDNGGGDNGSGDNGSGDNGGTCNCNPGEAPGICGAAGSEGVLVAHDNCNQFFKCSHGLPVALFCPEGLLYNPYIERCDWPALVECGDRPIVEGGGSGDNGGGDNGSGDNGGSDNGGSDNGGSDNGGGDNGGGDNGGICNCNPGEAPGICGAAGSEGVLVAHDNCNQFFKCSHGLPVALFCPEGLLYNPYIERCDWPALVECGDRPIVEGGGSGDNGGGDNGSGDNGGSDNGGGGNGGGDNGGTCNCNPSEAPGICGAAGSEGVLVAHDNCNQFFKCSHGLPVALFCPEGLLYNPYIERCDWPALVECGDRPIVEGGGSGDNGGGDNGSGDNGGSDNGGGGNGGGDNGGTCNCNPSEAPGICGTAGSEGVLVAHDNCNQFFKCSHGLPVALFCPEGLLYNPYIERCDWPALVECGDRPIVEGGGSGDNGSGDNGGSDNGGGDNGSGDNGNGDNGGNGGGDNGGNNNSDNCDPSLAPTICAASGSDGVLVAHEICNKFYKCSEGMPVALDCPLNLLYNSVLQVCDWPENVVCGDRTIPDPQDNNNGGGDNGGNDGDNGGNNNGDNCDPSQAPTLCAASDSDGVLVAHEICNKFYKCAEGAPVALDCPSNLLYNSVLQVCDWPQNVECGDRVIRNPEDNNNGGGVNGGDNNEGNGGYSDPSEAPTICSNAGSNGFLVAHEKCDQFYVCSYGKPVALNCPVNLLYNPAIEQCDWPRNVDCGNRLITEPESGGNDGTCSCNAREAPSICARTESNGKLIAHESCNQYYVCFEGAPVARSCPLNLFYDPHTEQCLWPATVSCEGRSVTTTYASLNKHLQARRGFF